RNAAKVDTELAALAQARAEQRVAQLNVQRTEVRATTDGIVTNLDLHAGDYLQPGAQALALIDTRSLRIEGYFEETKLGCITEGDAAVARLMGDDHDSADTWIPSPPASPTISAQAPTTCCPPWRRPIPG
ncbi:HlyD family secretion protein, partial [Acinetobacter baumannii]|uniref:HlyD family secretion protein n=1 Tax=Acinetobacter baumannii TaxID=470 RepID=UPI002091CB63